MRETFRVKGTGVITREPEILEQLSAEGKPALLCTRIKVEECFFHCGKALIRSHMWKPDQWIEHKDSLIARNAAKRLEQKGDEARQAVEAEIEKNYRDDLY